MYYLSYHTRFCEDLQEPCAFNQPYPQTLNAELIWGSIDYISAPGDQNDQLSNGKHLGFILLGEGIFFFKVGQKYPLPPN